MQYDKIWCALDILMEREGSMKQIFTQSTVILLLLCSCTQGTANSHIVALDFPPDHFPAMMVCDEPYTWSTDLDHPIKNTLPTDEDYYCEVSHAEGTTPAKRGK